MGSSQDQQESKDKLGTKSQLDESSHTARRDEAGDRHALGTAHQEVAAQV